MKNLKNEEVKRCTPSVAADPVGAQVHRRVGVLQRLLGPDPPLRLLLRGPRALAQGGGEVGVHSRPVVGGADLPVVPTQGCSPGKSVLRRSSPRDCGPHPSGNA